MTEWFHRYHLENEHNEFLYLEAIHLSRECEATRPHQLTGELVVGQVERLELLQLT